MHIAISGNIAAGKTTLTKKLADHYGWTPFYEPVSQNPYLELFYGDMEQWAFHLQVHFLTRRFEQEGDRRSLSGTVVQDRTIYEDALIFARNLHLTGLLNHRDYQTYDLLYQSMSDYIRPPDLLIYLKADVEKLLAQIKQRGRLFEQQIQVEYLTNLNELYQEWVENYRLSRVLEIDINQIDFVHREKDFQKVLELIESALDSRD